LLDLDELGPGPRAVSLALAGADEDALAVVVAQGVLGHGGLAFREELAVVETESAGTRADAVTELPARHVLPVTLDHHLEGGCRKAAGGSEPLPDAGNLADVGDGLVGCNGGTGGAAGQQQEHRECDEPIHAVLLLIWPGGGSRPD